MAISTNLFDALTEAEKLHKELGLGLHKSYVHAIMDGQDKMGIFICPVLEQVDTGVSTAPCNPGEIRYKDIAKVHRGENRINRAGYAAQRGDGWKRFFDELFQQKPELAVLGWAGALDALVGKTIKVWYTRSKEGYINVYFSEQAYQYALNGGAIGGAKGDEGKTLNEDCPF